MNISIYNSFIRYNLTKNHTRNSFPKYWSIITIMKIYKTEYNKRHIIDSIVMIKTVKKKNCLVIKKRHHIACCTMIK